MISLATRDLAFARLSASFSAEPVPPRAVRRNACASNAGCRFSNAMAMRAPAGIAAAISGMITSSKPSVRSAVRHCTEQITEDAASLSDSDVDRLTAGPGSFPGRQDIGTVGVGRSRDERAPLIVTRNGEHTRLVAISEAEIVQLKVRSLRAEHGRELRCEHVEHAGNLFETMERLKPPPAVVGDEAYIAPTSIRALSKPDCARNASTCSTSGS